MRIGLKFSGSLIGAALAILFAATAQAAIARQLILSLRALGLAPTAAAPNDLEALLADLRGDD